MLIDKIFDFDDELKEINTDIKSIRRGSKQLTSDILKNSKELNDLALMLNKMIDENNMDIPKVKINDIKLHDINCSLNKVIFSKSDDIEAKLLKELKNNSRKLPELKLVDLIVSSTLGIVATLIDILIVGTPSVKNKEFQGAPLTELIREAGFSCEDNSLLKFLSDKCKVPYDMSAVADTVTPNNHRLRSFGHDPLFGLVFAVVDIILGTTTGINNSGMIFIKKNTDAEDYKKYFGIIFYLGHLISDICTARSLPIPGWILTQLFDGDGQKKSIAKVAEKMYIDGFDIRHFTSMISSVAISNGLVHLYCKISYNTNEKKIEQVFKYENELEKQNNLLIKYKMLLITNAIGTAGNVLKIMMPPTSGNLAGVNLVQWMALIDNSIVIISAMSREMSGEIIIKNRKDINKNWEELLT